MSNIDINKNYPVYTEFKYPLNQSLNNNLMEDRVSNTPHKDLFFHFKPQMNMNNFFLNMNNIPQILMSGFKSPNKFSSLSLKKKEDLFDPSIFNNGYNTSNKDSSEFQQEKNNSNLYFNSKKKLLGKKRLFKYILSSEKKFKNEGNISFNIGQISLHGNSLLNLHIIKNICEFKNINFPKSIINSLTSKYKYFIIKNEKDNTAKNEFNLEKMDLTIDEIRENNLEYYEGEMNSVKIIKNYINDINKEMDKIKTNYINKRKNIYILKSILLIELLIRNCNLFTNYLSQKLNKMLKNTCISNFQKLNPANQMTPKFVLLPPKQSISNINNKPFLKNLPENHDTIKKKPCNANQKINFSIPSENNLFINKQKALFRAKIPSMNAYKCDFCERVFKNGQALGGHISQSHPKQSNKYKQKIEIRNSRTDRRELLYEARRRLFISYNIDLDYLLKNKRKSEIKMFIKAHKNEYKKELMQIKSNKKTFISNNLNNEGNNESKIKKDNL